MCMCVTLSGDLPCESCRRGVRVCVPIHNGTLAIVPVLCKAH